MTLEDRALPEGQRRIERWLGAQENVRRAESQLRNAKTDLVNAEDELAKWMLPDDAKPGEKICVWHVDSLVQVEVPPQQPHSARIEGEAQPESPRPIITVRLRGKHGLNRL